MIFMDAVSAPVAVGAKCPWIEQLAPDARLAPHELPNTNEEAFVPVTAILVIVSAELPVLVIVTDCDALADPTAVAGNERLLADKVTGEAGTVPVPLKAIDCGEVAALSVMVITAFNAPVVVGWKCP